MTVLGFIPLCLGGVNPPLFGGVNPPRLGGGGESALACVSHPLVFISFIPLIS